MWGGGGGVKRREVYTHMHVIAPRPHSPTGDLGVNGQNSEGMCQGGKPGTGKLYVYVTPPTPVGVWLMALGLRQHIVLLLHTPTNRETAQLIGSNLHSADSAYWVKITIVMQPSEMYQ